MTALVYGFVHAATAGWTDVATIGSFAIGLVLTATFIFVELRAESPITPLRLFADRNRSTSYVARLLLVAGMMGMFFFLTQFLRSVLGYSDLKTGFAFLPLTAIVFAASQVSARVLVDRVGAHRLMIIGITFSTLGMLWLTQLAEHSGYFDLVGPLLVFGLGNGLAFVPLTTAALDGVAPSDAGAASGLVNVMQQLGGSLGLAVLVTVFGTASKDASASVDPALSPAEAARHVFVTAADRSFWTATIFLVGSWLLVAFAIRPSQPEPVTVPENLAELDGAPVPVE
jgi:MFS family permease